MIIFNSFLNTLAIYKLLTSTKLHYSIYIPWFFYAKKARKKTIDRKFRSKNRFRYCQHYFIVHLCPLIGEGTVIGNVSSPTYFSLPAFSLSPINITKLFPIFVLFKSKSAMKKLPIGIQTLSKIIEGNFVYVDKTPIAYDLIQGSGYYFLSRPRRFGKSLFLDTLKEIFEGNKALFKGLYIYDKWDWDDKYPVLRVSLGAGVMKDIDGLNTRLKWILEDAERDVDIKCQSESAVKCFKELIIKSYEKYNKKVVILIDEYDKPILDNITNPEIAREMRDAMKDSWYYRGWVYRIR